MSKTLFPGVALVTGAASGIGAATAISFAREGCTQIILADLSETGLSTTARSILTTNPRVKILSQITDVSSPESINALFTDSLKIFPRIDYAVLAAGIIGSAQPSHLQSLSDFDKVLNVDYRGLWLCSRAAITQMLTQNPLPTHDGRPGNRGSIVNIASQLGIVARTTAPAYCSAKAAVIGLTKADAIDYSRENIRINCVCPGVIDTPMVNEEVMKAKSVAPMDRPGTAQEVADCVLFLCSSKASFVQGSAMVVDGGYIIN